MIELLTAIPIIFIVGIFCASAYQLRKEKKCKDNRRKCGLNKYNR
tara:strand:- start:18865 stop:18999 length:135 start_codon:yes stop_codon:yes gene_type:complete